jgi:LysM repeat protein
MINKLLLLLQLVLISALYSCGSYKPVASTYTSGLSAEDYINTYRDLAVSEMKRTGIPASITLAQAMIESDYGRSTLAREANNFFGIKCHDDWTGPSVRYDDDRRNECFRKYSRPEESFYDHSDFLKSGSRYSFLFNIDHTDYKGWAVGLKKAGYATNSDYTNMLIRKIEENNLWQFDREYKSATPSTQTIVKGKDTVTAQNSYATVTPSIAINNYNAVSARVPRLMENNRIEYIIVQDGDTKEKLEKEFQLLRWELSKYNDLKDEFTLSPGQILYLQPKREQAEPGKDYYTFVEGDTLYLISQRFGIKLGSLYKMNKMVDGTEPEVGKKICLRRIKPVN